MLDTFPPLVTGLLPTGGSYTNPSSIEIAATVTDDHTVDTVLANVTDSLGNSSLVTLSSYIGTSYYNVSFTNFTAAGFYNITILANDSLGYLNNTEITNFTYVNDTTAPLIDFSLPTPSDAVITSNTSAEFNASVNESALHTFTWNWNGTNYSMYDSSLVLMFNFDNVSALGENDTNVTDLSQYANNASCSGSSCPNWTSSGKYSGAFTFDGVDDYLNLGSTSNLKTESGPFTISTWIKPSGLFANSYNIITSSSDADAKGYFLTFNSPNCGGDGINLDLAKSGVVDQCISYSFNDGVWYHVVVVQNFSGGFPSSVDFYINGQFISSVIDSSSYISSTGTPELIGRSVPSGSSYFQGTIDEFRIYNRSLSVSEIQQQYFSNLYKYDTTNWQFYTNESGLVDGTYSYYGCANDSVGNQNCTETRTLSVDTTPPVTTLDSPIAELNTTLNTLSVAFTSVDNLSAIMVCDLFVDDISVNSSDSVSNDTSTGLFALGVTEGQHNWTVGCTDQVGNTANSSETRNFTVDQTAPTVSLISPINDTNTTNTTVYLSFNTTDNLGSVMDCSLYINDAFNQSNSSTLNATTTTFTVSNLSDAHYNWTVGCTDPSGTTANASDGLGGPEVRTFKVDTTSPVVSLVSPVNLTSTTNTSLNFTFNVTDDLSPTLNCSLYINDTLNQTNETVANDTNTVFSVSGFAVGSYNWTVQCTDDVGHATNSSTYLFTIASVPSGGTTSNNGGNNNNGNPVLSLSVSPSCTQNLVTISSSGDGLSGARVTINDQATNAPIFSGTTDSNGQIQFQGCGMSVDILVSKSGYQSNAVTQSLLSCSVCTLQPPIVPANNKSSTTNQSNVENQSPQCSLDSNCSNTQQCVSGACVEIIGCGSISNHVLTSYQCGSASNCPLCSQGSVCQQNICALAELSAAQRNNSITITALIGGFVCSNCDVQVQTPDGKTE
ncbi:LamG domain-containing protein, partial [Candidatus Micrarchaeota archaeon]|nr:LamG domain-containing protein [Candidatus Micrarchaeota archaeon]